MQPEAEPVPAPLGALVEHHRHRAGALQWEEVWVPFYSTSKGAGARVRVGLLKDASVVSQPCRRPPGRAGAAGGDRGGFWWQKCGERGAQPPNLAQR
jgi:hypothetical protein